MHEKRAHNGHQKFGRVALYVALQVLDNPIKIANMRSCEHTTNQQEQIPSLHKIMKLKNEIEKATALGRFAFSVLRSVPIEVCSSAELRGGPELLAAKQLLRTPLAICCLPVKSYMQIYIAFSRNFKVLSFRGINLKE